MSQKMSTRQLRQHTVLPTIGNSVDELGDSVLLKIDSQLAKFFEDRNVLLTDGGIVTFTGTQVQFTEALNLVLNQKISGAAPQVISLGSTTRTISASGRMIYAVIDRTAGTATVTDDATTLPAAVAANQEVFLIAKRVDATDGTQRLYFRTGAAFNAGQSARLGSAGSGSGGSGTGDDLNALTFKASTTDLFDDIPTSSNSAVDTGAGKTDASLYSAVNALFQLSYDASKTATTTGTAATLSGTPSFTVKTGDMLISGQYARRIATVNSQTSYVLESAFPTDLAAAAACVSQAVHSKDLNNFAGDGLAPSSAFSTSISQLMAIYEDTSTQGDKIFDINTAPVIGFTASADGTNFTAVQLRPTSVTSEVPVVNLPVAGTNLYLRFFANKTSGTGTVNILGYKAFYHRDVSYQDGSIFNQSSALTNGLGTQVNISSVSVVSGKTRVKVANWAFPVSVNSGKANGSLKVYLNGQKIPRYIDASATPDASYVEIDQNTIELDQDYSANGLLIEIIQDVGTVDASETNTSAIAAIKESSLEGFQNFVKSPMMSSTPSTGTPAAGLFHSAVIGRAQIPDLSQDLKVRMGIDRIMLQQIYLLQNEAGPNNEQVFGVVNDTLNQIRMIGNWGPFSSAGSGHSGNVGDSVEITFFGTGLNLLSFAFAQSRTCNIFVDGVAAGTFTQNTTSSSGIISTRQYAPLIVLPIVSNLSLGVHTVRLTVSSNFLDLYGFEVVSEPTSLRVNPGSSFVGGAKLTTNSLQSISHNSTFESGSLGVRGGRVVVYQKADGSIAKAVTPVGSQLNLTNADHSNEELVRAYHWREFGSGRTDDFSRISGSATGVKMFALDDGTTQLISSNAGAYSAGLSMGDALNAYSILTFVGTGLDLIVGAGQGTPSDTYSVNVNGTNIGNLPTSSNTNTRIKVVSGLPYGTHNIRFTRTVFSAGTLTVQSFAVYGPKKPAVPSGALELADYNILADLVGNSTAAQDTISTGVIRKHAQREFNYVNGTGGATDWGLADGLTSGFLGWRAESDRLNAYFEYTFYGTGFELRQIANSARSSNMTVSLQNLSAGGSLVALTTANFPSLSTAVYGTGVTYNASTGQLDMNDAGASTGAGFRASALPLALYKFRVNNNSASSNITVEAVDIITPIHSHKSNAPASTQNTLSVGSTGISDSRRFTPNKESLVSEKAVAQARGIVSGPTTTGASNVPLPDMSVTMKVKGGKVRFSYSVCGLNSGGASWIVQPMVNGIQVGETKFGENTNKMVLADSFVITLPPGVHHFHLYWGQAGSGTALAFQTNRNMLIEEV